MIRLKLISLLVLIINIATAKASETIIWEGTKQFSNWSDVLNIEGSKLNKAKADDVLQLSITASAGAQLQISWGSNWTNFDGLSSMSISGNYNMVITSQDLPRLRQGIHIKGVNYTLTAVTLKTNDGKYETLSEDLFAWKDMLLSGATQGQTCTVSLKAYGGAGWYWPESVNMSNYGHVIIELLQPASEDMTAQLFYNDNSVKNKTIAKGDTQCKIMLTPLQRKVNSLNIISEKAQTVAIGSVNLTDKQGNAISTAIYTPSTDKKVVSVEFYNSAGIRLNTPQPGINIIKNNLEGGRAVVRKEIR